MSIVINFVNSRFSNAPDDAPIEERVRENIGKLEVLDRSYFGKDRLRQIREILDASTTLLDTKPIDLV